MVSCHSQRRRACSRTEVRSARPPCHRLLSTLNPPVVQGERRFFFAFFFGDVGSSWRGMEMSCQAYVARLKALRGEMCSERSKRAFVHSTLRPHRSASSRAGTVGVPRRNWGGAFCEATSRRLIQVDHVIIESIALIPKPLGSSSSNALGGAPHASAWKFWEPLRATRGGASCLPRSAWGGGRDARSLRSRASSRGRELGCFPPARAGRRR